MLRVRKPRPLIANTNAPTDCLQWCNTSTPLKKARASAARPACWAGFEGTWSQRFTLRKHAAPGHRFQRAATAAVDVVDTLSAEPGTTAAHDAAKPFAWERNWWPVHVLDYLDPSRPTPVELLGQQLVLWRDAAGAWRCFRDSCPHRRVPLSEGRVEGRELVCSYHGWRFNEEGACTAIPQAPDAKSLAAATSSPRSCVASFPTQEAGGLLWVWPEQSAAAAANASAAVPSLPNAFYQAAFRSQMVSGWFMRELPYDYDILVENITDPSHLPYAHHALSSSLNRKTALPIPFTSIQDRLQPDDADVLPSGARPLCAFLFPTDRSPEHRVLFSAPGLVTYHTKDKGTMSAILAVPAGPGRSKVFVATSTSATVAGPPWMKAAKMLLGVGIPKWLSHMFMSKLFDGDSVFLAAQGVFLRAAERQAAREGPAWAREYFMPMTSDRAVAAARKWIDSVGGPVYPVTAPPAAEQVTREQLLDRHDQHTKHCPHCRGGLEFAGRLAAAGSMLLAAAFFTLCCLAGAHGFKALLSGAAASKGAVAAAVACLAGGWVRSVGMWLQAQLTFTDYVHADIP